MKVIIGGGVSGLIVASRERETTVLEQQPGVGGLYSLEEIGNVSLTILPPITTSIKRLTEAFPDLEVEEWKPYVVKVKDGHLTSKVCPQCTQLPEWLVTESGYFIRNLGELIQRFASKVKVIRGYPLRIKGGKLFTNRGVLEFTEIVNTGSREEINLLVGLHEELKRIGCLVMLNVAKGGLHEWDLLIHGGSGMSFSHVFRTKLNEKYDVYHVYAFARDAKTLDVERVLGDLKRASVLSRGDIITMRLRYVRDCILIGNKGHERLGYLRECGRLGLWENLSLERAVESALRC